MPKTTQEKCDRLAVAIAEMQGLAKKASDANVALTGDEAAAFDALAAEAKTLKAEVHRLATLEDLSRELDKPRPKPLRDAPDTERGLLELQRGRYQLRHFSPLQGRPTHEAHEAAYKTGLLFLARCGYEEKRNWARGKLEAAGVNIETLSPFQAEDGNTQGGYLVFPEFEATLISLKEQYGVYQQNAFKLPMASDTLLIPRRAGGTTVYYPGENTQITESAMKFDQVQLLAKKYAQMTRWSTELNEDSVIAMADLLAGEFAYQFAKAEDFNGFIGDGTSTYAGVIGLLYKLCNTVNGVAATASLAAAATTHTTADKLTLADWNKAVGLLPLYAEGRAKWYMHKTIFYGSILPLIEAAGGNIAMYLSDGAPRRFLGYEVVITQAMPTITAAVGTTATAAVSVPAVLGDMTMTGYMGQRRGVTVRTSDQRYIEYDQIAIQATQRVAINNVVGDSLDPANVAGPMVGLHLAAS